MESIVSQMLNHNTASSIPPPKIPSGARREEEFTQALTN